MSLIKIFTEKANHQALKALLCACLRNYPVEIVLGNNYSQPQAQLMQSDLMLSSANEMAKVIVSACHDVASTTNTSSTENDKKKCVFNFPCTVTFKEEEWL